VNLTFRKTAAAGNIAQAQTPKFEKDIKAPSAKPTSA